VKLKELEGERGGRGRRTRLVLAAAHRNTSRRRNKFSFTSRGILANRKH